ncbi:MAG: vitamin K epoxide reductase family protein [Nanoarchaeota archaeon]
MRIKQNRIKKTIIIFIVLLIIITGLLLYYDLKNKGFCLINPETGTESGCSSVTNSKYGLMFGIKLSLLGFIAFIILFIIHLFSVIEHKYVKELKKIFLLSCFLGGGFALYFIYLQIFILKKICSNCLIIDALMIVVLVLAFIDFKMEKNLKT